MTIHMIMSLSSRRAWIEMQGGQLDVSELVESLSSRRAWIEIITKDYRRTNHMVALLTESVD